MIKNLFCILFLIPAFLYSEVQLAESENRSVFIGLIIENQDSMIPYFLRTIENLAYDKKKIILEITNCSSTLKNKQLIDQWAKQNENQYNKLIYNGRTFTENGKEIRKLFAKVKDHYLHQCKNFDTDFCLILSSDVYLFPNTLSYLMKKNKPIISPLLRPIPEKHDMLRNFFADVLEEGYYKDHPSYYPIAQRQKIGTFKVPCVHSAYLIQTNVSDKLSFSEEMDEWELISFSNNARDNHVDQFICNEKEFGEILHFSSNLTDDQLRSFSLKDEERKLTSKEIYSLFSSYENDPSIKAEIKKWDFDNYAIYRVENRDLYFLDDINDPIKSFHLKENGDWGVFLKNEFVKYAKEGTRVIDLGSSLGINAIRLSKIVGDKGEVLAFEPSAKLFCESIINLYLNNCRNVKSLHYCLGSSRKYVGIYYPQDEFAAWRDPELAPIINENKRYIHNLSENYTGEQTEMKRLDSFKLKNVSLIHISLRGAEIDAIRGAEKTILINKPILIIEIPQDNKISSKIQEIEDLGYSHSSLENDYYLFVPKII